MRRLTRLAVLVTALLPLVADEPSRAPLKVGIHLADGSYLIGTTTLAGLVLHGDEGRVELALSDVIRFVSNGDRETWTVSTLDRRSRAGALDIATIELETSVGKLAVPIALVTDLQRLDLPAAALLPAGKRAHEAGVSYAMTWGASARQGDACQVGADSESDAYRGDTPTTAVLPILCFRPAHLPAPTGVPRDGFRSWSGGEIRLSAPIAGTALTSLAEANRRIAAELGPGWRMAEFHDASGWGLWGRAVGTIPIGSRFWVHIRDQASNPWDGRSGR